MNIIFFVFLTLITFCCNNNKQTKKFETPKYEIMADRITRKTAEKLKQENNLKLMGIGGGMMNNIRMMAMSFAYNHKINIDDGRYLLTTAVNEYLNGINSNEEIRPYLINYPFEIGNIEIRIFIYNPDRSNVPVGEIAVISAIGGIFEYNIEDPETSRLKTIHEETYEEAMLKIK